MSIGSRRPRGGLGRRSSNTFGKQRTSDRLRTSLGVEQDAYGNNWYTVRKQVLERDNYTCRKCGAHVPPDKSVNSDRVLMVDHIIAVAYGGQTVLSNLMTICDRCHENKPGKANRRGAKLIRATADRVRKQRHDKRNSNKTY